MSTVRQKIATGLQLKYVWVRVMLIVSTITILGFIFIPKLTQQKSEMISREVKIAVDSMATMPAPAPTEEIRRPISSNIRKEALKNKKPVELSQKETIKEKKPFDWKGTITWAIGAMNGLVLIILNIKNLLFKKNN